MPLAVVKGSLKYCLENKWFFLFVLILFFILEYIVNVFNDSHYMIVTIIASIILSGYGIQIIQDIINGGTRLPKIMPKKVIVFGIKGMIIRLFYMLIQVILLAIVSTFIDFPVFDVEEFFLDFHHTVLLFFHHDVTSFIIFTISGFIISYVTIFFMELSLAKLADGGQLRNSFNFSRIKHAIDIIGWRRYTIAYTKIILVIIIFYNINMLVDPYPIFNVVIGCLSLFIPFIVEYRGMGIVYKVYTDNKKKLENSQYADNS